MFAFADRAPDPDLAMALRARYVALGARQNAPEMVVKVISSATERDSARHMLAYIGRLRSGDQDHERVQLYWGDGRIAVDSSLEFREAQSLARTVFDEWDIRPSDIGSGADSEEDTESEKAGEARALVHHLTVSYPITEAQGDTVRVHQAVAAAVRDLFETGVMTPVIWGMHNTPPTTEDVWPPLLTGGTDTEVDADSDQIADDATRSHDHMHVHILVRARPDVPLSPFTEPGLWFDREDLQLMRATFAAYGQTAGLDVEATHLFDRVSDILDKGSVSRSRIGTTGTLEDRKSIGSLVKRAPDWNPDWIDHVFQQDSVDGKSESQEILTTVKSDPAREEFKRRFLDADLALLKWRLLRMSLKRSEKTASLADWYLVNRPQTFGQVTGDSGPIPSVVKTGSISLEYDRRYEAVVSAYSSSGKGFGYDLPPQGWTERRRSHPTYDDETSLQQPAPSEPVPSGGAVLASLEKLALFAERYWPATHPLGNTGGLIRKQAQRLLDQIALIAGPDGSDGGLGGERVIDPDQKSLPPAIVPGGDAGPMRSDNPLQAPPGRTPTRRPQPDFDLDD